jgi:hypothetical protein
MKIANDRKDIALFNGLLPAQWDQKTKIVSCVEIVLHQK